MYIVHTCTYIYTSYISCMYNIVAKSPNAVDVVSSCLGPGAERQAAGVCRRGQRHVGGGQEKHMRRPTRNCDLTYLIYLGLDLFISIWEICWYLSVGRDWTTRFLLQTFRKSRRELWCFSSLIDSPSGTSIDSKLATEGLAVPSGTSNRCWQSCAEVAVSRTVEETTSSAHGTVNRKPGRACFKKGFPTEQTTKRQKTCDSSSVSCFSGVLGLKHIKTKLTSDVLDNLLSLPVLSPGEILPPTAALDCLGADPACKDRVVTLVVTNPTVEYQVMQGSSSINSALVGGNRCLAGPDKSI